MLKRKTVKEVKGIITPDCPECKSTLEYIDPNEKPDGTFLMLCRKCNVPYSMTTGKNYEATEKKRKEQHREGERREAERREAERKEAERIAEEEREAQRRETKRKEAERIAEEEREAQHREAERKKAKAKKAAEEKPKKRK